MLDVTRLAADYAAFVRATLVTSQIRRALIEDNNTSRTDIDPAAAYCDTGELMARAVSKQIDTDADAFSWSDIVDDMNNASLHARAMDYQTRRILVACEFSGTVSGALMRDGHDVLSCDLLETEGEAPHYQGDVLNVLYDGFTSMIAHPPCTYLSASGLHWNKRDPERAAKTEDAIEFVRLLMDAPVSEYALENPVGCVSTRIRKPTQYIQPFDFGEDASKKTGLWLNNLPALTPTERVRGRAVTLPNGKTVERWANQTDSGQSVLGPSADRWKIRSRTYPGIARAMSSQWFNIAA